MGCFTEPRVLRSGRRDQSAPVAAAAASKRHAGVSNKIVSTLSAGSCSSSSRSSNWYDNKPVMLPSPQSVAQELDRSSSCSDDRSDKTTRSSVTGISMSSSNILHESSELAAEHSRSRDHARSSLGRRDQPARVLSAPLKIGREEYNNDNSYYGGLIEAGSGRSSDQRHFSAPLMKTSHSGVLLHYGISPPSIVDDDAEAAIAASRSRRATAGGYDTDHQCSSDKSRRLHGSLRRTESFGGRPRPLPLPNAPTGEVPVLRLPAAAAIKGAPTTAEASLVTTSSSSAASESRQLSGSCSFVSTSSGCCRSTESSSRGHAASIVALPTHHRPTSSAVDGIRSWSMQSGRVMPIGSGLHATSYQLPHPLPSPSVATQMLCPSLKAFDFQELASATAEFSPDRCIERNDQGSVYSAWIQADSRLPVDPEAGQIHVAVVRLSAADGLKGFEEWRSEVQLLSQLQDRNLCRLKGYCAHESARNAAAASSELQLLSEKLSTTWRAERLLVFEQSPNGSLHDHLFGSGLMQQQQQQQSSKTELLDWTTRIKIALGAARGLLYIHDRAPLQVVYRDFKASSILLDKDFKAKLAGYGLGISNCRTDKDISSSLTKTMKISRAYAKCNVWSFGVVLLELFTGKHSKDAAFLHDEKTFVKWAKPFLLRDESRRTVCPIIDSRLSATATPLDKGAQQNLLCLLLRCLKKDAKLRPSMAQVVEELKLIKDTAAHSTTRIEFSKQAFARLQNRHPTIHPDKGEFSNQAFA